MSAGKASTPSFFHAAPSDGTPTHVMRSPRDEIYPQYIAQYLPEQVSEGNELT